MPPRIPSPDAPPLSDGMRMDRETFHRVCCLHPEIRKAELVAEIGVATVALDVGPRKDAHEAAGIREYINWRVLSQAIDWYVLRDGRYELLMPDAEGVVRSEVFPGLRLDVPALLRSDMPGVLAAIQAGIVVRHAGSI